MSAKSGILSAALVATVAYVCLHTNVSADPGPSKPANWAGATLGDVPEWVRRNVKTFESQGVPVTQVEPNSPAEKAGLRRDDVIMTVNGKTVTSAKQIAEHASQLLAGDPVEFTFLSEGEPKTSHLTMPLNVANPQQDVVLPKPVAAEEQFEISSLAVDRTNGMYRVRVSRPRPSSQPGRVWFTNVRRLYVASGTLAEVESQMAGWPAGIKRQVHREIEASKRRDLRHRTWFHRQPRRFHEPFRDASPRMRIDDFQPLRPIRKDRLGSRPAAAWSKQPDGSRSWSWSSFTQEPLN